MSAPIARVRSAAAVGLALLTVSASALANDLPPSEVLETAAGRVHPLVVHFPIALLVVAGVVELTRFVFRRKEPSPLVFGCLVFGALGAAASAGSGWLYALHEHPGRSVEDLVEWHRWTGVVTAAAALLAIPLHLMRRKAEGGFVVFAYRLLFCVAVVGAGGAGHLGGELMYGDGYVTEPLAEHYGWGAEDAGDDGAVADPGTTAATPAGGDAMTSLPAGTVVAVDSDGSVSIDSPAGAGSLGVSAAPEFTADVLPIFEARCFECHGERKQKGKLRLDAAEHVWGPKRSRWSVIPGDSAASSVYQRIILPADDLDIMPAEGDPLTADEIAVVKAWIDGGARWDGADVPAVAGDAAGTAPAAGAGGSTDAPNDAPTNDDDASDDAANDDTAEPDEFGSADDGAGDHGADRHAALPAQAPLLSAPLDDAALVAVHGALVPLQTRGARAMATSEATQAVEVDLSLAADVTDADLALLAPTAPALVWLSLARTAVGDGGMRHLAGLTELRTLRLDGTAVGDAGLAELGALQRLEVLNLVGTAVGDDGLAALHDLAGLERVYLWGSAVTAEGAAALRAARPDLHVDTGADLEQALAALDAAAADEVEADG